MLGPSQCSLPGVTRPSLPSFKADSVDIAVTENQDVFQIMVVMETHTNLYVPAADLSGAVLLVLGADRHAPG